MNRYTVIYQDDRERRETIIARDASDAIDQLDKLPAQMSAVSLLDEYGARVWDASTAEYADRCEYEARLVRAALRNAMLIGVNDTMLRDVGWDDLHPNEQRVWRDLAVASRKGT